MVDSPQDQRRGVPLVKRFKHMPSLLRNMRWEYVMNSLLLLIAATIIGQTYYLHAADEAGRRETARVDAEQAASSKKADAENKATSLCLRDSVVGITDALGARLIPADVEREATRALILGFASQHTPDEGLALIADYKKALRLADRLRDQNPVPDYPNGLCESTAPTPSASP